MRQVLGVYQTTQIGVGLADFGLRVRLLLVIAVLSAGLSPCWIARSLSGNAATGSKVVSGSRDGTPARMVWVVPVSGAAVSMCQVPPTRSASSPGWSDVLKLLVVVIVADKTGRFRLPPMVRVYVEMKARDVAA